MNQEHAPEILTRDFFKTCGKQGGLARAAKLTAQQRSEISRKAGRARAMSMGQTLRRSRKPRTVSELAIVTTPETAIVTTPV
jgi:hypothetical protein